MIGIVALVVVALLTTAASFYLAGELERAQRVIFALGSALVLAIATLFALAFPELHQQLDAPVFAQAALGIVIGASSGLIAGIAARLALAR